MCYVPLCIVTVASVWNALLEAVHVLLCCMFLVELGLLPIDLGPTFTHSLYSGRTIDKSNTSNHQAHKPDFSKTKQTTLLC